jgi:hypothetical protein
MAETLEAQLRATLNMIPAYTWYTARSGRLTFVNKRAADYGVVVKGTSRGTLSGKSWTGRETPGGRFCNVFKFRGNRIAIVHVYLDPDYTGEDAPRFRWGTNRKW